jgi:taurine dioxygenase
VTQQKFTYTHTWGPNDLVLWDNWRTLHAALGYPASEHRRAVRTQIYGGVEMGRLLG